MWKKPQSSPMKKIVLFAVTAVFLCSCARFQDYAKYTTSGSLSIVEVVSDGSTGILQNKYFTRYMLQITEQTFKSKIYVLTREYLQQFLEDGAILEECEGDCLVQIGQDINTAYIIQAFIVKEEDSYRVTAEMYEVATGQRIASASTDASSENNIERAIFLSTAQMYNQFIGE